MNTDGECAEPRLATGRIRSLNSGLEPNQLNGRANPQNLCVSVFICGSPLHPYG